MKKQLVNFFGRWLAAFGASCVMGLQHAPSWSISLLWGVFFIWMMGWVVEEEKD